MFKKINFSLALLCSLSYASNLSLSDAYSMALQNDPKTKAQEYKALSQEDVIVQARSKLMPQLSASFTGGKQTYTTNYSPYNYSNQPYTSWMFMFTQPLLHLDDLANLSVEYIRKRATDADYRKQTQTLAKDLAKAYFSYIKAQEEEKLAKNQVDFAQATYLRAKGLLESGYTDKMDAMQTEIDYKRAKVTLITRQKQVSVSAYALEKLIGSPVADKTLLDLRTINYKALNPNKEYWESKINKNLDVYIAQTSLDLASRQTHARVMENMPRVDLQLSYNPINTTNLSVTRNSQNMFIVMNMPIFSGGYNIGRVNEARMLAKSAGQNLESATKDTKLNFEDIWSKREYDILTVELLKQAKEVSKLYVKSAQKQSEVGLKGNVDVYDAKRKELERAKEYIDACFELVNNELELLAVVGELNDESLKQLEKNLYFGSSK
jgi:outer membrane protein TolC